MHESELEFVVLISKSLDLVAIAQGYPGQVAI
jgi:hypothetical protein